MLALLAAVPAVAQDGDKKPDRLLRILAVGESPPYAEKIIDGKRVEQEPPKGSIPPRRVVLLGKEGQERGEPVRVQLGRLSAPIPVGPGSVPLHESGAEGVDPKPWHQVKVPRATHALALLWRDPSDPWSKPRSMTLKDDISSFPAGRVRVVNVSPFTVGLRIKGKDYKVAPYKTTMLAQNGQTQLVVALQGQGKWHKVYDSVLNQRATERTNVVIYKADRKDSRSPAKVLVMPERAKLAKLPR